MQVIADNRLPGALSSMFCVLLLCCSPGRSEITAEGVTLVPLTDDGKPKAVAWAYHGDWVAFVRQVGDSSQWQLHVMKADGSEARPACPVGDVFFAEWSWAGDHTMQPIMRDSAVQDDDGSRGLTAAPEGLAREELTACPR